MPKSETAALQREHLPAACRQSTSLLLDFLFKKFVEHRLVRPTYIVNPPLLLSPLAAELTPEDGGCAPTLSQPFVVVPGELSSIERRAERVSALRVADRFELYICGCEVADGYGELSSPLEQMRRFELQRAMAVGESGPQEKVTFCLRVG